MARLGRGRVARLLRRHRLAAVLLLALVVRTALLASLADQPERALSPDSRSYLTLAHDLHGGYVDFDSNTSELGLRRTPGYPVFLAAVAAVFGRSLVPILATQVVLGVGVVALTYLVGTRVGGAGVGLAGASLVALDPASIILGGYVLTETLATLGLLAAMALILRLVEDRSSIPIPTAAAAGFLLGLCVLTRPIALYLPLVLLPALVLVTGGRERRSVAVLVVALGFALPVGAWIARNLAATGVPTVSTVDGESLLSFKAAGALAEEEGLSLAGAQRVLDRRMRTEPGKNPAEVAREEKRLAVETLIDHKQGAVVSTAKGVVRLFLGPGDASLHRLVGFGPAWRPAVLGLLLLPLVLLLGGAAVGIVHGSSRIVTVLLVTVGYFALASAGPEAHARFRVPIAPLLAILSGMGWAWLLGRWRERRASPAVAGARRLR